MSAPDLDQELVDTVVDALLRAGGRHTDADYPLLAAAAIAAVGAYEAAPTAIEAREAWLVEPFAAEPDPQRAAEAAALPCGCASHCDVCGELRDATGVCQACGERRT